MKKRAVFLDRDGTIVEDVGYPCRWEQLRIPPASYDAVRRLNEAGFLVIVVTNQSGVGRGFLTEEELLGIHDRMSEAFARRGARIDAFYYCPHHPRSADPRYRRDCACRKPAPGLALKAAADLGLDLARSFMVGDKVEDIAFGRAAGAVPLLVLTGYGRASEGRFASLGVRPEAVAADLGGAVDWILAREPSAGS